MMNRDEAADVAIHDFSNRYVSQVKIETNNVCIHGIEKSIENSYCRSRIHRNFLDKNLRLLKFFTTERA